MMKRILVLLALTVSVWLMAGCSTNGVLREMPVAYDLGPLRIEQTGLPLGGRSFLLADALAPDWLDGTEMRYRLAYANEQQTHAYAQSRWSMPPAKLLAQRLKARMVQAGAVVLPPSNGAEGAVLLRMELEDFSQRFDSADLSAGQLVLRVSAFKGRALLAQKTFSRSMRAPTPDAAGGARALAVAADDLIGDVLLWLAGLPVHG